MTDRIERELQLDAPAQDVWDAVISDGWLADEVELDLRPGGDACFRSGDGERRGWVEDVSAPDAEAQRTARLTFWWATDDEPASRVELTIEPLPGDAARVRVVESRPLELLHLVGTPLRNTGTSFGPALVAA